MSDWDNTPPVHPEGMPEPDPTRVCRRCSTQTMTSGNFCPNCGASYVSKRGISRRSLLKIGAVAVALLLVVGGAIALVAKNSHDKTVAAQKRRTVASSSAAAASSSAAAASSAAAKAASQSAVASASSSASLAAEQKRVIDAAERERRKQLVDALQASITKDAKKDVKDGVLDGPIKRTDCNPADGGSDDPLDNDAGKFSCIAVNKDSADGTESGYRFSATVNWAAESYTWQLGG